jgi:hypothetical protein
LGVIRTYDPQIMRHRLYRSRYQSGLHAVEMCFGDAHTAQIFNEIGKSPSDCQREM